MSETVEISSRTEWAGANEAAAGPAAAEFAAGGDMGGGAAGGDALTAAEAAYFAARGEMGLPSEADEKQAEAARPAPAKTPAELEKMRLQAQQWQQDLAAYAQSRALAQGGAPAVGQNQEQPLEPQTPPDPREDFLGFARWQSSEIARLNQQLAASARQAEEESRAAAAEAALMQEWDNSVEALRAQREDADEALDFLQNARLGQLQALAAADPRFGDRNFCQRQIFSELRDIIIGTYQRGVNPAEAVYDLAKAYGYGRDETARLGKIAEAAQAARSLTAGAGGEAGDPYLLETVANLSEAEFAKWYDKNRGSFRAMFGG